LKHVSNVAWETLNKARHVDEKLAWEGKVGSEDEVFFTPQKNIMKKLVAVQCLMAKLIWK
jgi:hypothetical protein